jgi:hypothetical protein
VRSPERPAKLIWFEDEKAEVIDDFPGSPGTGT